MSHSLPPIYSKVNNNNNQMPKSFAQTTRNHQNHDHVHPPASDNNNVLTIFLNELKLLLTH